MQASLSFYTVATDEDEKEVETLAHADVGGDLQLDSGRSTKSDSTEALVRVYIFFPSRLLSGIEYGMKVVGSDLSVYRLEMYDEFESHQEIYLRNISA
jgi:hypothetical protein